LNPKNIYGDPFFTGSVSLHLDDVSPRNSNAHDKVADTPNPVIFPPTTIDFDGEFRPFSHIAWPPSNSGFENDMGADEDR
jgi:hypothetical protein